MNELQKFKNDLILELTELKKLGVSVSSKALEKAKDVNALREYYRNMSVGDCADLFILLY